MKDLSRLLRPKSVAIVGGGAWCEAVIQQLQKANFAGDIWPVHPNSKNILGLTTFPSVDALPGAPDATFLGVNRTVTVSIVQSLANRGAGGAVCFASGFSEVNDGGDLNAQLLAAAGDMPILGPNCYGVINNLDGALLWPDQHGCIPVESGVAILTQSSNIAINLTMQTRTLPISYVVTCGNQAQTSQAEIANALLDDPRVTAIGVHIEGFSPLATWEAFARKARKKNIPIVALKVGRSQEAQTATISHTASLAGQDAGAQAFLDRLGISRVDDLEIFLETLKIYHVVGPLPNNQIATVSCSGGEASLAADIAQSLGLSFPPLKADQLDALFRTLGAKVTLSNPLDYHTYIWRNADAMTHAFSGMLDPDLALTLLIVDFPRPDRCDADDWECAISAAINANANTSGRLAMVATLPELMPEDVASRLLAGGVIPMSGLSGALGAVKAAIKTTPVDLWTDVAVAQPRTNSHVLSENDAKTALNSHGLHTPNSVSGSLDDILACSATMAFPLVLKGEGFAHKTENNAVVLNIQTQEALVVAARAMNTEQYLLEEMIGDAVAELIIGASYDNAHGHVLTIGAGGILTELLEDTQSLLVPASEDAVIQALTRLKIHNILDGYRGKPAAAMDRTIAAILAIQSYVLAHINEVSEVEVNPLICTPTQAIAADALIRKSHD